MPVPASGIVTVRLPPRDVEDIDEWVEKGHFTNRSDFLRYAVRVAVGALRAEERDARVDLDSLLHGPGTLPAGDTEARSAKGRGSGRRMSQS